MKLYKIFIPKQDNTGKAYPDEKITSILNAIEKRFGGYTVDPFGRAPSNGVWSDGGESYSDEINVLDVFTEDTYDIQEWFKSQIESWRKELNQEEMVIIFQNAEIIRSVKKSL